MTPVLWFNVLTSIIIFLWLTTMLVIYLLSLSKKRVFADYSPAISIIIPAYNEEKTIAQCVRAAKQSIYKGKTEILVINDGSTDNTAREAKKAGAKVITKKNAGKAKALNTGVSNATYAIVVTIDADTFVSKSALTELIKPLQIPSIGSTTGIVTVRASNILSRFQAVEYLQNHLIRTSFSRVFGSSIWFFGSLAAFKKTALKKAGGFSADTLAEDMDIALTLERKGYSTFVANAYAQTIAPQTIKNLVRQRRRWWPGTLEAIAKNRKGLWRKKHLAFLFINQGWWSIHSGISLVLIMYQIVYWWPDFSLYIIQYFAQWFSLLGPISVYAQIPSQGVSLFSIFGVSAGAISTFLLVMALLRFKQFKYSYLLTIFFYFPYTILINTSIFISLFLPIRKRKERW